MHRVDVSRAVGGPLMSTGDHDGRIVSDVVAEWGRRHGRPFRLHLEGPAGGDFAGPGRVAGAAATADPPPTLDAVELGRILSGRAAGSGPLTQLLPS